MVDLPAFKVRARFNPFLTFPVKVRVNDFLGSCEGSSLACRVGVCFSVICPHVYWVLVYEVDMMMKSCVLEAGVFLVVVVVVCVCVCLCEREKLRIYRTISTSKGYIYLVWDACCDLIQVLFRSFAFWRW